MCRRLRHGIRQDHRRYEARHVVRVVRGMLFSLPDLHFSMKGRLPQNARLSAYSSQKAHPVGLACRSVDKMD